jgi:hypothetical protein
VPVQTGACDPQQPHENQRDATGTTLFAGETSGEEHETMELRTAFTTALALFGAAAAVPACELLDSEPLFCAPKIEGQGPGPAADPQCTSCIEDKCGNAGENCAGECEAYGDCTCECAEDDAACFDLCADKKSDSCRSCEETHSNAVLACMMKECQVCAGGGPSDDTAEGNADAGDDPSQSDSDDPSWSDSGDPSWTDTGDPSWTDTGDPSWTDTGVGEDTGSWSDTGGGGAACEQLHSQCCPNLEGFDLELCETTTDEGSCEFWLEIFQEEGKC